MLISLHCSSILVDIRGGKIRCAILSSLLWWVIQFVASNQDKWLTFVHDDLHSIFSQSDCNCCFYLEYIRKQTGSPQMVVQPAETAKRCQMKDQVYGITESSVSDNADEISSCQFSRLRCS